MNKLISNINGGYPFVLDDLRFQDDAYREALKGIFNHFEKNNSNDGIVFHQKEKYPWASFFPETFCFYDGEIYKIPQTTFTGTGNTSTVYRIKFSTNTYQTGSPGTKVFQDGQTHETYQIRTAYLEKTNAPNSGDFIALNYSSGGTWDANQTFDYRGIMKQYLNLNNFQTQIDANETNINTNTSDIQTNTIDIQLMNNDWKYMSETYKNQFVRFNSNSAGSGSAIQPEQWDTADKLDSHVKFKRLNDNTGVIDFNIRNITCQSNNDDPVASLKIKISEVIDGLTLVLPTKLKPFNSNCEMSCKSHAQVVSGTARLSTDTTGKYLVISKNSPF